MGRTIRLIIIQNLNQDSMTLFYQPGVGAVRARLTAKPWNQGSKLAKFLERMVAVGC
jgi:hypothetical protein